MLIQPSDEALTHAFLRELLTGEQLKNELQASREKTAAEIARDYRDRGRRRGDAMTHVAEIPQREYFQMIHKYGQDCWDDVGFVRDFQRLEPTMASNKI